MTADTQSDWDAVPISNEAMSTGIHARDWIHGTPDGHGLFVATIGPWPMLVWIDEGGCYDSHGDDVQVSSIRYHVPLRELPE